MKTTTTPGDYSNVPTTVIEAALDAEIERLGTLAHGSDERRGCFETIKEYGWELKNRNG